ncbi:integrase, catalytic region, zinc finger, CCHC-type containing protein [Tanacetum coccineum]
MLNYLIQADYDMKATNIILQGDDPIACLNKAMAFLTTIASSRFPSTNDQLRTSSNPRNQATIQDGRVIVLQVQGRQGQSYSSTDYKSNATSSGGNNASGQERDKAMSAEAQEVGQILDEEQLAFLADPGVSGGQVVQTIIPNNAAFQTEDLDTYDSECDDISNAKAVLMANISNYSSDVISEDFEQTLVVDATDNEITSDSNIIMYSQYLQETQQENVQDTNLQAQQDSMILSVIEKMSKQDLIMFRISNPTIEYSNQPPIKVEVPSELPKVSLVNASLKKLKFHLAQFDSVVKKRTTPDARTEDLLNEIMEVQTVFDQMDTAVQQSSVDKQYESCDNQNALEILEYFENNDLKAQLLDKDTTILKGKEIVDIVAQIPSANTIVPGMFKLDLEPLAHRLLQNREAHIDYLKYTQEQADILWGIVKQAKAKQPLHNKLDFTCNKKNDRISRTPSKNMKNKVEAQPRKVNKKNCVVEPIHDVDVKHSLLKESSELICATCKKSMFDGVHDMCLLNFVENVNSRAKSTKKHKQQNIWKPRVMYSLKLDLSSSKKAKIVESKNANHSEPNHTWRSNATDIPSSSSLVMTGYPDCSLGLDSGCLKHMTGNRSQLMNFISKFLGHGHNLFSVGQFCDTNLEVAFWKNTCFIRNLEGVDLLFGSRDTNLYTIYLNDMLETSLICLLSKASKTKSWLWHRRLSHLNFGTLNKLAKDSLARAIPRLKFKKDHVCFACALGKSKKSSHHQRCEDTYAGYLYLCIDFVWPR